MTTSQESTLSDPRFPPPPPETPAERKGRMIALFIMPFLIITMMYATYVGTTHDQTPSNFPVAVMGSGAEATAFADKLESDSDGKVEATVVAPDVDVLDLLASQEVAGVIEVPGADGVATIHQASAGGAAQASLAAQLITPSVVAEGWTVETNELAPLPAGDATGTMVMFAALGMMLGGYVPLSGLLGGTPNLLRVRKFAPLALGWSVLLSGLLYTILGPIVGAIEGNFLPFMGLGVLSIMAVAFSTLLFTKVMGPFAVLLGMLFFVIFGTQASNLGMSIHSMPGFFGWLHGILPMPAAGEALRSIVYFDNAYLWGHILVLAIWLGVAALLCIRKDIKSDAPVVAGPLYTHPDAPLAALAGGPVASYKKRLAAVALFPLAIVMTVVGLMSFSMTKAELNDFPIAVVAPTSEMAQQFTAGVGEQMGDVVEFSIAESEAEGRDLMLAEKVGAVFILPTAEGEPATLMVASGSGPSQVTIATSMMKPVAEGSGMELVINDIAPLKDHDTNGANSLYIGMSWIMAGFLIFAVFRGGAPDLTKTRQLLPFIAGWSVGISLWLWFLFDILIGAVDGHFLPFVGIGALTIFCVAWVTAVITRPFGLFGIIPVMIVVMLAGTPASGGGMPLAMVPEFFGFLNNVLPLPAAVEIARAEVYLDGTGIGANVLTIVIWGVIGLLLNFLVVDPYLKKFAKPHAPMGPKAMPERGPKKGEESPEGPASDELAGVPA